MVVCSSCDEVQPAEAAAGTACSHCGERLILVDTEDVLLGKVLEGRFRIDAPLGRGGMGVVYRGTQLSIGREVAIKMIDRTMERDAIALKRFFREAKLASSLAHPNTVPIIDFGQTAEGQAYIVMELVRGKTLFEEIHLVGPLAMPRVFAIVGQLLDALEVAHEMKIIHRDLKPENVMLLDGKRDHVKILDFGLARSLDPGANPTAKSLIAGTPRYMAPEVLFESAEPAPSQDMYALGVIICEMLLGDEMWNVGSLEALGQAKLDQTTSLAGIPGAFAPLIRALIFEPPKTRPDAKATRSRLREIEHSLRLELDPIDEPESVSIGRAPTPYAPAVAAPLSLQLVSIDERETPVPRSTPVPKPAPSPPPSDPKFKPAPEPTPPRLLLNRADVRPTLPPVSTKREEVAVAAPPSRLRWLALVLLVLGVGGGIGGYLYSRQPSATSGSASDASGEVLIVITTAEVGVAIYVDGEFAGATPVTLKVPPSTTRLVIGGEGLVTQEVIPDHDQHIRMEKATAPPPIDAPAAKPKKKR